MGSNDLLVSEEQSLLKSVEQMSKEGDEPPSAYHVVEGLNGFGSNKDSSTQTPIPIIDVSLLSSEDELQKLRSALSSAGLFQAIGHGMSVSYLDKMREVVKQFFALPVEEKNKCARAVNDHEGYGCDTIVSEKQVLDWSYRMYLQVFPEEIRKLSVWPQNPPEFGEVLVEYAKKVKSIVDDLLRSMARSLDLEEGSFLDQFGEKSTLATRINFYPPCSRPDLVLGCKPHTDGSGITVLLQDKEVEGLQVQIDDKWVNVPTIPDALFINIGDQMQIISNGVFKSPMHRVVTNTEKLRMSLVVFNVPDAENEIGPVEGLINETRPRLYRNIKDYLMINYSCYQEGKIPLETIKVAHNSA
ncbi:jasmonate-induced oxygenase 4-like [Lotus japonicus]|uniref:2-oxoglutarate-dependent dioxygenase n=1 Tax=Lotus japonicus TaxID=34305 RepID=A0A6F8PJE3_LOTJA|nr:jasmonate-induced oxygenase 4-like [Lotus japonicus]BBO93648.1 2-oxoglutarate-dependent dioxygenase [Lotus japonicus]